MTEYLYDRTPEHDDYDRRNQAKLDALKPLLTTEFLATLIEAAKTTAWDDDFAEVSNFVKRCHEISGVECPSLDAYDYDKELP